MKQVVQVELSLDAVLPDERRVAIARTLASRGYSRIDLERAALALSADVELSRAIRYAKGDRNPLSAADFSRVIDGDPESPEARSQRVMTYNEAMREAGRCRLDMSAFAPVFVDGEEKPRWTYKP